MRADLEARGLSEVLQRVERAITTSAVWGAKPGAAREDVLATWQQLVVLHQKTHALLREKKDAELALGEEPTEANLAWLKDVSARLESLDGTEALIEGFGELSGRFRQERVRLKMMRTAAAGPAKRLAKSMVWLQKQG